MASIIRAADNFDSSNIGQVLQVQTGTYSGNHTISGTAWSATPVQVNITPTSATSKIIVIYTGGTEGQSSNTGSHMRIYRNGSVTPGTAGVQYTGAGGWHASGTAASWVDTPNTTSAVNYRIYVSSQNLANASGLTNSFHTIIAIEVAA